MRSVILASLYADLNDYDLVVACQQKIEAAFNALYKRYQRYVHGVLKYLAPDLSANHDDLVQEVFLRIWKSIDKLLNPRAFKTWLNRLIKNLFYDELRKRPKDVAISLDEPLKGPDGGDGGCRDIVDSSARPDECCERIEMIVHINAALARLPEPFKNVLVLREFDGLSYEEIALRTRTGIGTVKSRIARGRAKMQSQLQQLKIA